MDSLSELFSEILNNDHEETFQKEKKVSPIIFLCSSMLTSHVMTFAESAKKAKEITVFKC